MRVRTATTREDDYLTRAERNLGRWGHSVSIWGPPTPRMRICQSDVDPGVRFIMYTLHTNPKTILNS